MRQLSVLLVSLAIVAMVGISGCASFSAKSQMGQAQKNPAISVEHGFFSGTRVTVTSTGSFTADDVEYSKTTGLKATKVVLTSDPVPAMDAQTRKILEAMVPMSQEYTRWSIQFGDHLVSAMQVMANPLDILASVPLVAVSGQVQLQLPQGVTLNGKSVLNAQDLAVLFGQMAAVIDSLKSTPPPPVPATQPAAKPSSTPVPTQ